MYTQKSPVYTQKSPMYMEKSPVYIEKTPIYTQMFEIVVPKRGPGVETRLQEASGAETHSLETYSLSLSLCNTH